MAAPMTSTSAFVNLVLVALAFSAVMSFVCLGYGLARLYMYYMGHMCIASAAAAAPHAGLAQAAAAHLRSVTTHTDSTVVLASSAPASDYFPRRGLASVTDAEDSETSGDLRSALFLNRGQTQSLPVAETVV